ncbi:Nif3-like dinuclear metal center hexameric protein [Alkanindiges sp. WGS2144]|uniref:Nif3-like dinuclear metal center hexameric protein n=1 Tax=Alkanindiges sp. WGS2144 TaxID=3366808 RepID=UPI003751F447
MVELNQLIAWCNQSLNTGVFKDYCPNGLQVEGRKQVSKLITAVTASQEVIDYAVSQQADALLVHHGYFWKGEPAPLTGIKGQRIKTLMQHDISLIAYHLPLDAHPVLGNNAALADLLDIQINGALDPSEAQPIGNIGQLAQPVTVEQFIQHLTSKLNRAPLHLPGHTPTLQKIGFCTGAAQDFLYKAAERGCDAYISGEVSERTYHEARELGIHYFACGHHATERGGVQKLGQALAQQFELQVGFADFNNPV